MGSFARAFAKMRRPFTSVLGRRGGMRVGNPISINGTFADATGWTLDVGCTVNAGTLWCNNTTANVVNSYAISLPAGVYKVTYDVTAETQGNVLFRLNTNGAGVISGVTRFHPITLGTYTEDISAPAPIQALELRVTRSNASMDCRLDNLIIQPYIQE